MHTGVQLHVALSGDAPPTSPCCCMQLCMHKEKRFSTTMHAQMFAWILLEVWSGKYRAECSLCSLLQELDYFNLTCCISLRNCAKVAKCTSPHLAAQLQNLLACFTADFFQNITPRRQTLPWFMPHKLNFCVPLCQAKGPAQTHPRNSALPSAFMSDCWMGAEPAQV